MYTMNRVTASVCSALARSERLHMTRTRTALLIVLGALALSSVAPATARAHETDQYTLPVRTPFADLRDYLDNVHYRAVDRAVRKLNAEVTAALADPDPERREAELLRVHEELHMVEAVFQSFSDAFTEIQDIEYALRTSEIERAYPDQIVI